jgi:hypothetical protein
MRQRDKERRFRRIREIGCLACQVYGEWSPPEVHHLNLGGLAGHKRRGDEFTIGLCRYHHRGVGSGYGPSLSVSPLAFRVIFGKDDELLAEQNRLIDKAEQRASILINGRNPINGGGRQ